jgi:hypothetical protein
MQYLITKEQIDALLANHLLLKHETDILKALPVLEGEPVAHLRAKTSSVAWNSFELTPASMLNAFPVYTHSAPFVHITADMVTDEMIEECYPEYFSKKDKAFKEMARLAIAPAYNAVCKYMGAKNPALSG